MTESRKAGLILLLLYVFVLGINFTVNYPVYAAGNSWVFSVTFSMGITTIGWLGYVILYYRFFKSKLNWKKHPTRNLLFSVLLSGCYGIAIMMLSMKTLQLTGRGAATTYDYAVNSAYAALFSMLFGLIINGQDFLHQWKKSADDNERMKMELLQSQHEALKNQVNPHFLFNALNTLTSLIPERPDTAIRFVQGLSSIFRYSLQHHHTATVSLATELHVATAFLFLNQQRFGDKLIVTVNIPEKEQAKHIVTHALLTLVENAIKHNEISTENPLSISIDTENGTSLVVTNPYQPRQQTAPSLGLGLANIVERYKMVSDQQVTIRKDELFTVRIPLLEI
jgi:two-component system LytT family sensor kinase